MNRCCLPSLLLRQLFPILVAVTVTAAVRTHAMDNALAMTPETAWRDLAAAGTPCLIEAETLSLAFGAEVSNTALGRGWRDEERGNMLQRWTDSLYAVSTKAELRLTVLEPRDLVLRLEMQPFPPAALAGSKLPPQEVTVVWNQTRLGVCHFGTGAPDAFQRFEFDLPAAAETAGANTLTFLSSYAVCPEEARGNTPMTPVSRRAFALKSVDLLDKEGGARAPEQTIESARFENGQIAQAAGSRIRLPLRLPEQAACRFVLDGAVARQGVSCRALLRADSPAGPVEHEMLPWTEAGAAAAEPIAHDCSAFAGQVVEIVLEARRGAPDGGVLWNAPRVVADPAPAVADTPAAGPAAPFSNVVVVVLDALRADAMGCYGYHRDTTPFLDKLASDGVLFEHAYAAVTYTYASTWSLFTGQYAFQHQAWGQGMVPSAATLAECLQGAGIATGFVTANPNVTERTGHARGFTAVFDAFDEPSSVNQPDTASPATRQAVEFIRTHADQRFFLYVHHRRPHAPYRAPEGLHHTFTTDPAGRLDGFHSTAHGPVTADGESLDSEETLELRARYDENVRAADREIEWLYGALQKQGLAENTLFIVTADHGDAFGEHDGLFGHGNGVYETQAHIPLILYGKGASELWPKRCPVLYSNVDLLPTVCALMGVAPPPAIAGENLLAKAARPVAEGMPVCSQAAAAAGGFNVDDSNRIEAFVWPRYKLIRDAMMTRLEVYDLDADPGEQCNLVRAFPVLTDYLRAQADAWKAAQVQDAAAPPNVQPYEQTPEDRQRFEALGYL